MSQTNTRAAGGQTARDARSAQQRAVSLFSVTLVLFLLPCAAFAEELGAVGNAAGWAESEGSATAASPGKAPFTFSPDVRLINSALLFGRRSLLAQTHTGALAAAPTVNLTTPGPWGTQKSYLIPALEIVGFDVLLNLFDRAYYGCCDFDVDLSSIKRNLRRGWNVDRDKFTVNQIGHPYQGSMYHGFARASGLGYWEGMAYTFLGSLFWEIAGETTPPSRNDQINTGIGGSFLGETLFRMSSLWLEQGRTAFLA